MTMKPASRGHIIESEELLGEELFLYNETNGAVHTLNSGAAMVWLLCDGIRDLKEIAQEIASTNRLPEGQVLPEVQAAVAQFQTLGLLEG